MALHVGKMLAHWSPLCCKTSGPSISTPRSLSQEAGPTSGLCAHHRPLAWCHQALLGGSCPSPWHLIPLDVSHHGQIPRDSEEQSTSLCSLGLHTHIQTRVCSPPPIALVYTLASYLWQKFVFGTLKFIECSSHITSGDPYKKTGPNSWRGLPKASGE